MMYKEITPSITANNIIDEFWVYRNGLETNTFKVLPDNCTDLIFDINKNNAFVSGVMTQYQLRNLEMNTDLIGIRIRNEQVGKLSEVSLVTTKNLRIPLSDLFSI